MNINELNDAWIQAGQKVSDLNAKLNTALVDDEVSADEIKNMKAERDNAMLKRDGLKEQLDLARKEDSAKPVSAPVVHTPEKKAENAKDHFVNMFKGMIKRDPKVLNEISESGLGGSDTSNAGLTVPQDIETQIHVLMRQYASLQQYVRTEAVSTLTGSRVYEKWNEILPLKNLDDESAKIGANDDPNLQPIKYHIHRYAGISTITDSLLHDSNDNLLAWLTNWIAHKSVVTRNQAILNVASKNGSTINISSMDDLRTMVTSALDPAITANSVIITSVSAFNKIANMKDSVGRYYLDKDVSTPNQYSLLGKKIVVVADRWLNVSGNTSPIFYGDLSQGITLFDREHMSLLTTNIGNGAFENDNTQIRVIDRFDVEGTDNGAYCVGTLNLNKIAASTGSSK